MDYKNKDDPFDLVNPKRIKIKEYLVFKQSSEEVDKYIIQEKKDTKVQNLQILHYIQKFIQSAPDINSEELSYYLKQQRIIMKLYLNEINKK